MNHTEHFGAKVQQPSQSGSASLEALTQVYLTYRGAVLSEILSTGCPRLDELLKGGLRTGELSLVYGEPGTGKTSLAIQISTEAARRGFRVLYVDGDRSFTHQRFSQIAGADWQMLGQYLLLFVPETFTEQASLIGNLENYLTSKTRLVILDTVTSLYRVAFSPTQKSFLLNRELNRQLACLSEIAIRYDLAVLAASQVHTGFSERVTRVEPVARRTLYHWAKTILVMKSSGRSRIKYVHLERHNAFETKVTSCILTITDKGLEGFEG